MNLFTKILFTFSCLFLILQKSTAQINNTKGKIITSSNYFDSNFLIKNKIKTISISFSSKKELQPMVKDYVKKEHYNFDIFGRTTRYYTISTLGKTKVEWRRYKKNQLFSVHKTELNEILTRTYYYENGKNTIQVYGTSKNTSYNKLELSINNYIENDIRYYKYLTQKNGTKIKETMSSNKVTFKQNTETYEGDLLVKKETTFKYFGYKNDSLIYKYDSSENLIKLISYPAENKKSTFHTFVYNKNKQLTSINKYDTNSTELLEHQEFLYSKETGYLQAILTKNKITQELTIKKYKYTFY